MPEEQDCIYHGNKTALDKISAIFPLVQGSVKREPCFVQRIDDWQINIEKILYEYKSSKCDAQADGFLFSGKGDVLGHGFSDFNCHL